VRRDDSDLELTVINPNMEALYACTVKTNDGQSKRAEAEIRFQADATTTTTDVDEGMGEGDFEVGPITIGNNQQYISYSHGPSPSNSVLRCPYDLSGGAEVNSVVWRITKRGRRAGNYKWKPNQRGQAFGMLKGKVNVDRGDSDLELTALNYAMAGNFSCTVVLSDGSRGTSPMEEVLVVDASEDGYKLDIYKDEGSCSLIVTERTGSIFPPPTVRSGLYSQETGNYLNLVDNWQIESQDNGSVSFSSSFNAFQIDESTPMDAEYRSEIGVTKSNGEYVRIFDNTVRKQFDHSCRELELHENQQVQYNSYDRTCFGEIRKPDEEELQAVVTCAMGFVSRVYINEVRMTCVQHSEMEYEWAPGGEGFMPYHLSCVVPPSTTTELPHETTTEVYGGDWWGTSTTSTEMPFPSYPPDVTTTEHYDDSYDGGDYGDEEEYDEDQDYGEDEEDYEEDYEEEVEHVDEYADETHTEDYEHKEAYEEEDQHMPSHDEGDQHMSSPHEAAVSEHDAGASSGATTAPIAVLVSIALMLCLPQP